MDERVDAVASTARRLMPARLTVTMACAILTAIALDWRIALPWAGAYLLLELTMRLCTAPLAHGGSLSLAQRRVYVASIGGQAAIWCGLAAAYWFQGGEAFHIGGMAMVAGLLIHAQSFSHRSPATLLAVGPVAALTWVALPSVFGAYHGAQIAALAAGLGLFLAYVIATLRLNQRVTEELAAARLEAEAANAAKSAFLATMSHELRTPLNGVLGMARALQRTPLDARQQQHVETILRSGDGLLTILNDVLDLSKIEAGRMDLDIAPFDLRRLAEHAADLWAEQAAAKGVALTCSADPALPAAVLGDETRIRQILLNLVSNAIKFTDEGAIGIALSPAPSADGEGGVSIRVSDTGIGMSEEQLELLFRPFTQAEVSIARRYGGTGLGLTICRQLAERMGGRITVESRPDAGATFDVWLPLPGAEPLEAPPPETLAELPPLTVLVADDNPINQAVARTILEAAGCEVETAADGAAALDQLRRRAFDLVLMDVHMPRMDGVEAVRRVRAGEAGRADIPVIALTGDAMVGEDARLRGLGFDALQPKPVQPAALLTAMAAVIEARPAARDRSAA